MKRYISLLLAIVLLISFWGCDKRSDDFERPATFYYPQAQSSLDLSESMFRGEIRETAHCNGKLEEILNIYLSGPTTDNCVSPFPANLFTLSVVQKESTVTVTLSNAFSQLEGFDLSIASICISMTLFELVDCEEVVLRTNGDSLSDKNAIVISKDSLYLSDQYHNGS